MPQGLSVADAIYHTVHGYPGGVSALAARMGVSANTLTHKANPNNATHHLHPQELVALQHLSGDASVLHAMAAALGFACTRALPDQAGGSAVEAVMRLQCAFADFMRAVADPLARMESGGATWATNTELRRAAELAGDLQAEIGHMVACLRAHKRPAPRVGG